MFNMLLRIFLAIFFSPKAGIDHTKQWKTRSGEVFAINKMTLPHLHNTVRLLLRKAGESMVPQLLDSLDQRVPPEQFSAFHIIQRMFADGYKLVNFAHPSYEAILAQYRKLIQTNPRVATFFEIQLREYEAKVIMSVAQRVEANLVLRATDREAEKAAQSIGVSVVQLGKSMWHANVACDELRKVLGADQHAVGIMERLALK